MSRRQVGGRDRHSEMVGYRPLWHGALTCGDRRRPTQEVGESHPQQDVKGDTRPGAWGWRGPSAPRRSWTPAPASRARERHVHCRRWTPRGERETHTRSGDGWLQPRSGEEDKQWRRELAQDTRVRTLHAHVEVGWGEACAHHEGRGRHEQGHTQAPSAPSLCPPPGLG